MANVMAGVCGVFALDLDSQAISLLGTVASVPRSPVWL